MKEEFESLVEQEITEEWEKELVKMKIGKVYFDDTGALVVEVPELGDECVVYPEWIRVDGVFYDIYEDKELLREVLEHPERFVLAEWRDNQYSYHYYLLRR